MRLRAALVLAALCAPASATASVLFSADFEPPAYALGALVPQNGWTDQGGSAVRDSIIANGVPGFGVGGTQTLASQGGPGAAGFSRAPYWTGVTAGTVVADLDVLPDPGKTTGIFLGSVGVGAGAYVYFDVSGVIRVWDGAGMVSTGIPFAQQAYHMTITLDIDADRYAVALDGTTILSGLDARSTPGPANPVEVLELFGDDSGSAADVSYLDNIVVSAAAPEPGILLLFLLGAAISAAARGSSARRGRAFRRAEA